MKFRGKMQSELIKKFQMIIIKSSTLESRRGVTESIFNPTSLRLFQSSLWIPTVLENPAGPGAPTRKMRNKQRLNPTLTLQGLRVFNSYSELFIPPVPASFFHKQSRKNGFPKPGKAGVDAKGHLTCSPWNNCYKLGVLTS